MAISNILTYGLRQVPRKVRVGVPKTKFLQDHFFGGEGGIVTADSTIDLKIKKSARPAAEEAEWDSKGHILGDKNGYTYLTVKPMYLYDRHVVTPSELLQLDFEEDPANPLPYDEKMMLVLRNDREDLYDVQDTKIELLAKEVLKTGGYVVNGVKQDFGISASMFVDCTSDKITSAASKLAWLQAKCQAVYNDSGRLVNEIVMDVDTLFALLSDSAILAVLDNHRIDAGALEFEQYRDDGVAFHGYLMIPGFGAVALLTYAGRYTQTNGTDANIWESKAMLFGSRNVGNKNYARVYSNAEGYKMSVPVAAKDFIHVVEGDGDIPSNIAICKQTNVSLAPMTIGGWLYATNVR